MLSERDKIKYLWHIKEKWLQNINKKDLLLEIPLFNNKNQITNDKTILTENNFDDQATLYILQTLINEWLILEDLKNYDLNLKNRFKITQKWYYLLKKYSWFFKIELFSKDYIFISSLIISIFWWLIAWLLALTFK